MTNADFLLGQARRINANNRNLSQELAKANSEIAKGNESIRYLQTLLKEVTADRNMWLEATSHLYLEHFFYQTRLKRLLKDNPGINDRALHEDLYKLWPELNDPEKRLNHAKSTLRVKNVIGKQLEDRLAAIKY